MKTAKEKPHSGLSEIRIIVVALLLSPLVFVLVSALLESGITIYEYKTSFMFENRGPTEVSVGLGNGVKEYIVPDIPGWQRLDSITVYLNGRNITTQCSIVKQDGNSFVRTPSYKLKPGEFINITVVQKILVYWAENGFTLNRRMYTLSSSNSNDLDFLRRFASTNLEDFWSKEGQKSSWKLVVDLADNLKKNTNSTSEYIHAAAKWVDENIVYDERSYRIKYPAETLYERKGACGDRAALVTALLRLEGIPSFMCLAMVYKENLLMNISSASLALYYQDSALHVFSIACKKQACVPVDTTVKMPYGKSPYIDGAGVNVSDKVIILAIMKNGNPNDYLTITLPSSSTSLIIIRKLERREKLTEKLIVLLAFFLPFSIAVLTYTRNIDD